MIYIAIFFSEQSNVTLYVTTPNRSIEEPNFTDETIQLCFFANLTEPRSRDAQFLLSYNESTATLGTDYFFATQPLINISADYVGVFRACVPIVIMADDIVEDNETVVIEVVPESEEDAVVFQSGYPDFVIDIEDRDGKTIIFRFSTYV